MKRFDCVVVGGGTAGCVLAARLSQDPGGSCSRFVSGPEDGYSVMVSAGTPASRGSLCLASADPYRAPVIDLNYLADDRDLECMITGLRRAREVGAAVTAVRAVELFPGPQVPTDDELRTYL